MKLSCERLKENTESVDIWVELTMRFFPKIDKSKGILLCSFDSETVELLKYN